MEFDYLLYLRNCLFLGSAVIAGSMVPEPAYLLMKPFIRLYSRISHFLQFLRERIQCTCQSSFFEIDMTKFEP